MKRLAPIVLLLALLVASFAPVAGGTVHAQTPSAPRVAAVSHSNAHFLDKIRFLAHVGVAYYAFHHWVIKPWKAHAFKTGSKYNKGAIIKAGLATLFALHELHVAYNIANKSSSKLLHALVSPLNKLLGEASKVGANLKKGKYNPSDVTSLSSQVGGFANSAKSNGYGITDIPAKIPGL